MYVSGSKRRNPIQLNTGYNKNLNLVKQSTRSTKIGNIGKVTLVTPLNFSMQLEMKCE
jgi:hypothetical protein